jgi:hypothetical protein
MDIAKGMLDLPPDRFGRKTQRVTFEDERKQVPHTPALLFAVRARASLHVRR